MKRFILFFLLTLWPLQVWADSLIEAFKKISPAVGALYSQSQNGSLQFNCTVTAIDREKKGTVLLTAHHCLTKDVAHMVTFDGRQFYSARVWKIPHEEVDPQKFPRHYGEPKTDMALFLISESHGSLIPLGTDISVQPGQKILAVGFPLGITKTRYEGLISGRLNRPGSDQHGYLILQTFGSPGSSGTAIVDATTLKVLGVLVSGAQSIIGLPVIFATPIDYLKYLLEVPADRLGKTK